MNNIITIEYKNGEFDFGINTNIKDLSLQQMNDLRVTLVVAISQVENMWLGGKPQPGYTEQSFNK